MGKIQRIFKRERMNECLQTADKQKKGEGEETGDGDDDGSEELGGDWGEVHEGEDWTTSWC